MTEEHGLDPLRGHRLGGWLPANPKDVDDWIRKLDARIAKDPRELVPPIKAFAELVYSNPSLHRTMAAAFAEAYVREKETPLGTPQVRTFEGFLARLNHIVTRTAPEFYECRDGKQLEPCGLIGFPINALLDWPMGTEAGYAIFSNELVNQQFKKILSLWSEFLVSEDSRYVLVEGDLNGTPKVIPWLSEPAKRDIVEVACSAKGDGPGCSGKETFSDIFVSDPSDPYYGYGSWDDFFTRTFVDGVRPVASKDRDPSVIINACESAPFRLATNVSQAERFWLKGQPYSLENMLDFDDYTEELVGGTVYQAFLSALSYHRWHSPIDGRIKKARVVNGSYYLESMFQGFQNRKTGADSSGPNNSQGFLTAVATRALIFIEADNPDIGLMCVMPVGMAEVSSCEITVQEGQHVKKGDQLGMFHFGGSTHCLLFGPQVDLDFGDLYGITPGPDASTNIRVNARIATVNKKK